LDNFFSNVCISAAVANTGIDKVTIEMVIRMGIPRDVETPFQERGKNAGVTWDDRCLRHYNKLDHVCEIFSVDYHATSSTGGDARRQAG